ncbi:hypothetical protein AAGG74_14555 [Bacillus mexicanus]|uniref:hypothetical protein n=1 Tax=Bacillus mexicanus TaxID=2834415 RepID=UPI003D1C6E0B
MKALIAKKEYVYYYSEFMFSDIQYIEIGERINDFKQLAQQMDLEILAIGEFEPDPTLKLLTVNEFSYPYFEIRKSNQLLGEDDEGKLEEYCAALEAYLTRE